MSDKPEEPTASFDDVLAVVAPVAARFAAAGYRLYLVGGLVRDLQLRSRVEAFDIDCTTDARPPAILDVLSGWVDDIWTQGARFGTIGARHAGRVFEITTHRSEVYVADSRKPIVAYSDRLDDDLARRDFTVNAMAIDPTDGSVIDPFDGRADLARRVLRTPLEPDVSFSEDPLRMMRAARFAAAYDLVPVPELVDSIRRLRGRMSIVSTERVRDEIDKMLRLAKPSAALATLRDLGIVDQQIPGFGSVSSFEPVDACADVGVRRLAVLVHLLDSRRPAQVARRLKHGNATVGDIQRIAVALDELGEIGRVWTDEVVRRFVLARAPDLGSALADVVGAAQARWHADPARRDAVARASDRIAELAAREDLHALAPLLDGDDVKRVLALDQGPAVGRALAALTERRLRDGPASREAEERYLLAGAISLRDDRA